MRLDEWQKERLSVFDSTGDPSNISLNLGYKINHKGIKLRSCTRINAAYNIICDFL